MPEDQWIAFAASGKERRHNYAIAAAILILVRHLDPSVPEADRCDRIVGEILDSMLNAEAEMTQARLEPSVN
jgi:hypothetical protein